MSREDDMTWEDAWIEINDAEHLLRMAYRKLINVEKRRPKPDGLQLKGTIINIDCAQMYLGLVKDEYSENGGKDE